MRHWTLAGLAAPDGKTLYLQQQEELTQPVLQAVTLWRYYTPLLEIIQVF